MNKYKESKVRKILSFIDDISEKGYKEDSPYKDKKCLSIKTPTGQITMKGVKKVLLGIDNLGNSQIMYPEKEYKFKGTIVKEIPLRARTKFSSGGKINGMSAEEYLDKNSKTMGTVTAVTQGVTDVGAQVADSFIPGSGALVKGVGSTLNTAFNVANTMINKDKIKKAKMDIMNRQIDSLSRSLENKNKLALGYV